MTELFRERPKWPGLGLWVLFVGAVTAFGFSGWDPLSSSMPGDSQSNELTGISCASSSFCIAGGYYTGPGSSAALLGEWTGSGWHVLRAPTLADTGSDVINGVSCAGARFCVAVGSYSRNANSQSLTEVWNGSSWSTVSAPNHSASRDNVVNSVSCVSASFCMAAGSYSTGANSQTLAEMWNGSGWSVVASPNRSAVLDNTLDSVSCASTSFCMAAGSDSRGTSSETLVERWDGTSWSLVSSPNPNPAQDNALSSVSCAASSFCMAAGHYSNGWAAQALLEAWNGSTWTVVSAPNSNPDEPNYLYGVSCTSADFCMAAGDYSSRGHYQTILLRWNGINWSQASLPGNVHKGSNEYLSGVSCTSATFCIAAGDYSDGSTLQTLVEQSVVSN